MARCLSKKCVRVQAVPEACKGCSKREGQHSRQVVLKQAWQRVLRRPLVLADLHSQLHALACYIGPVLQHAYTALRDLAALLLKLELLELLYMELLHVIFINSIAHVAECSKRRRQYSVMPACSTFHMCCRIVSGRLLCSSGSHTRRSLSKVVQRTVIAEVGKKLESHGDS